MKKILIADDSMFMRRTLKRILTNHGYDVVGEAENGKIAVEMYKMLSPDIVTLDITMHEMTGVEALADIVKYDENANVIMVSAMGQSSFIEDTVAKGAKGFIVKPFKEEAVIAAIERL